MRTEDTPGTFVESDPIRGIDNDDNPTWDNLKPPGPWRHEQTGREMSHETRAFLERVWR